ncbi:MAG: ATP-binding protein [Bacteroidales bacterium]|nr:ATP-binding protein [Bacteroidales bacterium]
MKQIEIRNFGPIVEGYDGMMPVYPITIFCGNQGAGKSTVAKLISTFSWIEKGLVRGDLALNKKTDNAAFFRQQCEFHRIQNYFKPETVIHFEGTRYNFHYESETFSIEAVSVTTDYPMPKIMYVPAERNFLTVVEHPDLLKEIPQSLFVLFSEYDKARRSMLGKIRLPIEGFVFQYDKLNNVAWLTGNGFKVRTSEAASGFQSLIPLSLVTLYDSALVKSGNQIAPSLQVTNAIEKRIADILADNSIDENMRRLLLAQQASLLTYGQFINIVEEPEQNLYPASQRNVLFDLFAAYNKTVGNQLIITTHSPYLIDYTTLAVKAASINAKNQKQIDRLEQVVPKHSRVNGADVCVYQIEDGKITPLERYDDMPSDDNMLNRELNDTNEVFAQLLEIEDM